MTNHATTTTSVLVIGATGETGLAVLEALSRQPANQPVEIHAMVRDPTKLQNATTAGSVKLASIQKGNARSALDIEFALAATQANWVIISVGNGDNVQKNDIRTANAEAIVRVLKKPAFHHIRAMVVSSTGAGTSKIVVGMGIGALISHHLRHVLSDHTGQEKAFLDEIAPHRTIVVRATSLTTGKPVGKLISFGDTDKSPTIKTDRADLAEWIANEILGSATMPRGGVVNLTGVKQQ